MGILPPLAEQRPASRPEHRVLGAPPAACFFVLAYAFSWAWLLPVALAGGTVRAGHGWPTHFPALLGPMLAAVALTAWLEGRRGLSELARRMLRARVPLRWWLFAISPLLLALAVLIGGTLAGRTASTVDGFAVFSGLPASWGVLGVAAAILAVNGFGEESGWRGYAQPALQRLHSPLIATLILSAAWAGWHLPMFFVVGTFRSFGALMVAGWIMGLFCGAIVLAWLYNRSGGSILLVAVWHTGYNLVSGTRAADGLLAAVSTMLVMTLAITLVGLELRATRRGSGTVLGPRDRPFPADLST